MLTLKYQNVDRFRPKIDFSEIVALKTEIVDLFNQNVDIF